MTSYEKFCHLRDHRMHGAEAPMYTEAEAFTLSLKPDARTAPKLYLAGPMGGIVQLNFQQFHAEAARLRALGFEVITPAALNSGDRDLAFPSTAARVEHWQECMRVDLAQLLQCDSVALLDGWTYSAQARLEQHVAFHLGMAPRLAAFFVERAYEERDTALAA